MIIKKLNSMFHKHSRWIFGIFAAVIIIAFMDFLTPGGGGCAFSGSNENQVLGTAFGEDVTVQDLIDLDRDLQMFESLTGYRSQRETQQLFYLFCTSKRAEQLGFTVSDKQVAEFIRMLPVFAEKGKFSSQKFDEYLKNNHISSADLAAAVRKVMTIEQLPMAIAGNVVVSDQEVENIYRSNFPRVAIRAFKVNAKDYAKLVKIDNAALKKYMAANKAKYVIPGKMDVLALELSAAPFTAAAEKVITDEFIAKLIKDRGLGEVDVKLIRPQLVRQKASDLASARMNSFYRTLITEMEKDKNAKNKAAVFRKLAADAKFTVIEANAVNFSSDSVDTIVSPELIAELRSMPISDSISPITRPRRSEKGYAMAFLLKRSAPRPMTFAEAEKQLTADYRHAESCKLASIKAKELWSSIMKLAPAKRSAAFGKLGKCETITYSMISAPENNKEHMAIIAASSPSLRTMKTGDISKVIDLDDGSLLVEMIKRMPAVMSDFAKYREMLKNELINNKMRQLQLDFGMEIERNCRYYTPDGSQEQ